MKELHPDLALQTNEKPKRVTKLEVQAEQYEQSLVKQDLIPDPESKYLWALINKKCIEGGL